VPHCGIVSLVVGGGGGGGRTRIAPLTAPLVASRAA